MSDGVGRFQRGNVPSRTAEQLKTFESFRIGDADINARPLSLRKLVPGRHRDSPNRRKYCEFPESGRFYPVNTFGAVQMPNEPAAKVAACLPVSNPLPAASTPTNLTSLSFRNGCVAWPRPGTGWRDLPQGGHWFGCGHGATGRSLRGGHGRDSGAGPEIWARRWAGPSATEKTYQKTLELIARFEERHGSCLCRVLLDGCDLRTAAGQLFFKEHDLLHKTCMGCVQSVVETLTQIIDEP